MLDYRAWCLMHFRSMYDGGMWGVPRSGLIFQRSGDCLRLVARMPWHEDMPISEEELREQQDDEFKQIQWWFHKAEIPVFDIGE